LIFNIIIRLIDNKHKLELKKQAAKRSAADLLIGRQVRRLGHINLFFLFFIRASVAKQIFAGKAIRRPGKINKSDVKLLAPIGRSAANFFASIKKKITLAKPLPKHYI
jgi:hypothetical protein